MVVIRAPIHHPPRPSAIGTTTATPRSPYVRTGLAYAPTKRSTPATGLSGARGRAWREFDGRGLVQRVVDQAILWPLRSATGVQPEVLTTHQPTRRPGCARRDGTEGLAPARVRPQVRPNVTHVLTLPSPRHSPSIGHGQTAVPLEQIMQSTRSRVGCSIRFRRCSCRPGIGLVRWPRSLWNHVHSYPANYRLKGLRRRVL